MQYQPELLETRKSKAGWLVVPVHLRHDPDKDEKWEEETRRRYRTQADANRELDFDTREVLGDPAYSAFLHHQHVTDQGIMRRLPFSHLPICLSMDFNVTPMAWGLSQILNGSLYTFDEIVQENTDAGRMADEFRQRYPRHGADIYLYGDATGKAMTANSKHSCYDLIYLHMSGYPSHVVSKVPISNPPVRDRIAAVNEKLKGTDGAITAFIHPRCEMLITDFEEVVLEKGGSGIHKTNNRNDPYFYRTHASDGWGYLVSWEWPIFKEVFAKEGRDRTKKYPSKARRYARVIGSI